jgi:hypothetical protein
LESIAEIQPKLQPALLRLAAMISNTSTPPLFTDYSGRFSVRVCSLQAEFSVSVGPRRKFARSHRGSENIGAFMLIGFAPPKFVAFSFMVPNLSLKSLALPFSVF